MLTFVRVMALALMSLLVLQGHASTAVSEEIAGQIISTLQKSRPDLQFDAVSASPVSGLYKVRVNGNQFLYATADGKYVIAGEMYETRPGYLMAVQDKEVNRLRQQKLASLPDEDFLIFNAENGPKKAVIYVFTDIDCGYCRKLHLETVPGLNRAGVEVRYLAFPRAGLDSESYRKIATAWCAEDRQQALTRLKQGEELKDNVCKDNPVAEEYQMGVEMGVRGTPALVLADGSLLPGYRSAEELLEILGLGS